MSAGGQVPSNDGVGLFSRRKLDARKLFEESLQKVKRTGRVNVSESSELMHLLLAPRPPRAAETGHALTTASARQTVDQRVDDDAMNNVNVVSSAASSDTSTDEQEVLDVPASVGDDRMSVFTSDKLDEYLAQDRVQGAPVQDVGVDAPGLTDSDLNCRSLNVTDTGEDSATVSTTRSPVNDAPIESVDSTTSEGWRGRTSEVEVDFIDGFSFYSFSTSDALLEHIDDSSQTPFRPGVDAGGSRTKKFQYGIAGNMSKYLARMKGWEKRTTTACDQRADALDALLSDGMVQQLSDSAVMGLELDSTGDGVTFDGGARAGVGRYPRRGVGKMGDEERQPRKGRIYGRKFDGRFASKANIHYHIKRRRSPTSPCLTNSESSLHLSSSSGHSDSENSPQSVTTQRNISRLLSPSLQPRVDLTKAVIPHLKTSLTKHHDRLPSRVKEACTKNKAVVKSPDQIHLIRLTEAAARRAIVALQLAPSMTNSPMKCNKPSMINSFNSFN